MFSFIKDHFLKTLVLFLALFFTTFPRFSYAQLSGAFSDSSFCSVDVIDIPVSLSSYHGKASASLNIELMADEIDYSASEYVSLIGNVSVTQGGQAVYADRIAYKTEDQLLKAVGDVVMYSTRGDRLSADLLQLDLVTQIGYADHIYFQKVDNVSIIEECNSSNCRANSITEDKIFKPTYARMRGYAEKTFFDGHGRERLENVRLTSCVEGNDSVVLAASRITLDHDAGEARGKDLQVRFFDVPIFYFPVVTFPITDDRKTGFLFPSLGFSSESGARIRVPYYLNISPNQDATLTVDHMIKRGTLLRGEYRYMGEVATGEMAGRISYELLAHDRKLKNHRAGWSLVHDHSFTNSLRGTVRLGDLSDENYLDHFGDDLGLGQADYIPQSVSLNYRDRDTFQTDDSFKAGILFSDFKTIIKTIDLKESPYARLPQITTSWHADKDSVGGLSNFHAMWTRFRHSALSRTSGDRINIQPSFSIYRNNEVGFVRPQLDFNITSYNLNRWSLPETQYSSSIVPTLSLDSGLTIERDVSWIEQSYIYALSPRLYYVYTPYVDQENQPIFDDRERLPNSSSDYFWPNRFRQTDRVGDTNRISFGLDSRLADEISGREVVKTELAQIFYFSDRRVRSLVGQEPLMDRYSDMFGSVKVNLNERFSTSASAIWSWQQHYVALSKIGVDYIYNGSKLGLSYIYDTYESQEDLSTKLHFPLTEGWVVDFENVYSLQDAASHRSALSVGYDACCWAINVDLASSRRRDNESWRNATEVIFTLQLKDLGKISSNSLDNLFSSF